MGKDNPGGGGVPPVAFGCKDPQAFNWCGHCQACGGSGEFLNNCCTYLGCPDTAASNYVEQGNTFGNFNTNYGPHPGCVDITNPPLICKALLIDINVLVLTLSVAYSVNIAATPEPEPTPIEVNVV